MSDKSLREIHEEASQRFRDEGDPLVVIQAVSREITDLADITIINRQIRACETSFFTEHKMFPALSERRGPEKALEMIKSRLKELVAAVERL